MSSQKGNDRRRGAPKHQNTFAFRHNPKSKLTAILLALPNEGLCQHCHEKIEWKKKYRKYKRLSKPKRCTSCQEQTITHAYHVLCQTCAREKACCAWCREAREIVNPSMTKEEIRMAAKYEEGMLAQMSLREKRSYWRQKEREKAAAEAGLTEEADKEGEDGADDGDDSGSSGEEQEEEGAEGEAKPACDKPEGEEDASSEDEAAEGEAEEGEDDEDEEEEAEEATATEAEPTSTE